MFYTAGMMANFSVEFSVFQRCHDEPKTTRRFVLPVAKGSKSLLGTFQRQLTYETDNRYAAGKFAKGIIVAVT